MNDNTDRWSRGRIGGGGSSTLGLVSERRNSNAAELSRTLSSPIGESTRLVSLDTERRHLASSSLLSGSPLRSISSVRQPHQVSPAAATVGLGGTVKRKPTSPLQDSRALFKSAGHLAIDPQVFIDAKSRGLVKRLVKYHEIGQQPSSSGSTINRSQSLTSLYGKPGQFPVVHLNKKELKFSPRRNNNASVVTSVRIAPPEKSVFQAKARSSILRAGAANMLASSSALSTSAAAENRVIAPPSSNAELEAVPTRSVLDALKEISRKRINSEELDADRIKKQCKETEVDLPSVVVAASVVSGNNGGGGMKRTRDLASSQSPPSPSNSGSQPQQQAQKKRLCSKNNDISSSLSSSIQQITPRRRIESIGRPRPGRLNVDQSFRSSIATSPEYAVDENDGYQPQQQISSKLARIESEPLPTAARKQEIVASFASLPCVVPSAAAAVSAVSEIPVNARSAQPRITLFNKKYNDNDSINRSDKRTEAAAAVAALGGAAGNDDVEEDEEIGRIQFIKPKTRSPLRSENVTLKRVERSKLSAILSCLSEDFEDDFIAGPAIISDSKSLGRDMVDAVPAPAATNKEPAAAATISQPAATKPEESAGIPKLSGISALINNPIKDPGLGSIAPSSALAKKDETKLQTTTKEDPPPSVTQSGGFKFGGAIAQSTLTTTAPPATAGLPTFNFTAPTSKPAAAVGISELKPSSGGFTFGATTTASITAAIAAAATAPPPAYTFPSQATTTTAAASSTTTTANLISFSPAPPSAFKEATVTVTSAEKTLTTLTSTSSTTTSPAASAAVEIKFGQNSAFNVFKAPMSSNSTGAGGFSSGGPFSLINSNSNLPQVTSSATTTTTTATSTSGVTSQFGGSSFPPAAPVSAAAVATTTTAPSSGFSFVTSSSSSTTAPAPIFGTGKPVFSFGGAGGAQAPSSTTSVSSVVPSSFGQLAAPASVATTTTTATTNSGTTTQSSFIFGTAAATANAVTTTTQNPMAMTTKPSFTFGGGASLSSTNTSTSNNSTNLFGTGNSGNVAPSASGTTFTFGGTGGNASATPPAATTAATANVFGGGAVFGSTIASTAASFGNSTGGGPGATTAAGSGSGMFGGIGTTPAPSFGGSATSVTTASSNPVTVFGSGFNTTAPSPFGGGSLAPASQKSIFGTGNQSALANNQPSATGSTGLNNSGTFTFGASAPATQGAAVEIKPFTFGGATTGINTSNSTAGPAASSNILKANSSFSFTGGASQSQSAAPGVNAVASPTFNFNAPTNNASNVPTFGSSNPFGSATTAAATAAPATNQATVKPFSFGGSTIQQQQQQQQPPQQPAVVPAFNFTAGSNISAGAPNAGGPFNFTSPGLAAPSPFGQAAAPNGVASPIFSIGTGGGNNTGSSLPQRRYIRTATRRLHK